MTELELAQEEIWKIQKELHLLKAEKYSLEVTKKRPALQKLGNARGTCIRLAGAGQPFFEAEDKLKQAQRDVDQVTAEIEDWEQKIQLAGSRLQQARGYYHKLNNSNAAQA